MSNPKANNNQNESAFNSVKQENTHNATDMDLVKQEETVTARPLNIVQSKDYLCIDMIQNSVESLTDRNEDIEAPGALTNIGLNMMGNHKAERTKFTKVRDFYRYVVGVGLQQKGYSSQVWRQEQHPTQNQGSPQAPGHVQGQGGYPSNPPGNLYPPGGQGYPPSQGYPPGPGYPQYPQGQGYPQAPGYVQGQGGYPSNPPVGQGYPPGQGYPQYPQGPGYPQGGQGYPQGGPGYPQGGPGYPQGGPGYPQGSPGYPQSGPGYPQGPPPPGPENGYGGGYATEPLVYDPKTRNAFVRLVMFITFIMLLATAIFIMIVMFSPDLRRFFRRTGWLLFIIAVVVLFGVHYALMCLQCTRRPPWNFICLIITVVAISIIAARITSRYKTSIILFAFIATAAVVFVCFLLACSSFDFTSYMLYIIGISVAFSALVLIVVIATMATGVYMKPLFLVILIVGTLLQVVILTMELQMILGGRTIEISEEDYALAAYMLYTSIIDIFLKMVQILGLIDG